MSPAVQLSFKLRTSSNVRSVHLLGSWDNYSRQLPLSAVRDYDAKPGSWKGTFRFQGSQALQLGSRYWYYYIIDGYHVSHDPAQESVVERTTGRKLNVLDVPGATSKTASSTAIRTNPRAGLTLQTKNLPSTRVRRRSAEIPMGRALSPTRIQCPRPQKPYASRGLREADYETSPIDDLEERFAGTRISDHRVHYPSSPSDLSDLSSASGGEFSSPNSASPSSCSSVPPACRCERYGVTRDGRRVKLDCGGRRCGYESSSSDCGSSGSDDEESGDERYRVRMRAPIASMTRSSKGYEVKSVRRQPVMLDRQPQIIDRRPDRRR